MFRADNILVVHQGKLVDQGKFDDLIARASIGSFFQSSAAQSSSPPRKALNEPHLVSTGEQTAISLEQTSHPYANGYNERVNSSTVVPTSSSESDLESLEQEETTTSVDDTKQQTKSSQLQQLEKPQNDKVRFCWQRRTKLETCGISHYPSINLYIYIYIYIYV
jgi:ABC-type multidrug transport system ATPase subunit